MADTNAQGLTVQQMSQAAANPRSFGLNPQGLTAQQMGQKSEDMMKASTIQQAQANPGTLAVGGQLGATPTGQLPQSPITFQAHTMPNADQQRQAGIQEVARLNNISLDQAAQRYDAATNRPQNLPPGTVFNPATGQVTDPRTGAVYAGSTGPNFEGMRFIDPQQAALLGITGLPGGTAEGQNQPAGGVSGTGGTGQPSGAPGGSLDEQLAKITQQTDEAFNSYQQSMQQLQNGTFPLTGEQGAQVQAMQDQLNAMKQAQMAANDRFTRGMTQAGISSGRARYAPEIEMGNIQNTINSGLSKIRDIEIQGMQAMSDLKKGFDSQNYQMINDQYDKLNTALEKKSSTISSMMKAVNDHQEKMVELQQKAEQDQRDFEYQQAQDKISQAMADRQQSWREKQDAVKNTLDQANFDEDKRKQIDIEQREWQKIALKQQANDPSSPDSFGAVPVKVDNVTGAPNKGEQAQFLDQLPPDVASTVQNLTSYTMSPKNISLKDRAHYLALAHQLDPSFDESQYDARAKYNNNYTSGQLMQTRNAINTGISHLEELKTVADNLQNKKFTGPLGLWTKKYNSIENLIKDNSGDPDVAAFNNVVNKVATELAKVYKGSASPTDSEIKEERSAMGLDSSPEQMNAVLQSSLKLLSGKLSAIRDDYQTTMGKAPPDNIIKGDARNAIRELNSKGIEFDLQKVDPQTKWDNINDYADDHPDKEDAIANMLSQDIPEQDIIDYMEGNIDHDNGEGDQGESPGGGQGFNMGLGTPLKGSLSLSFESSGNPGAIGYDSTGGYSYGLFQLAHNNAKSFIDQSKYASDFKGLGFNTPAWQNKWKEIAKKDPQGFAEAQTGYITQTHVEPQIQKLESAGLNVDQYSPALKEVLFSTAVQHGPNTNVVLSAVKSLPKNPSEDQLIKAIYKARWGGGSQFARSTPAVKRSVYNRFFGKNGEMNKALALANKYNA